MNYLITFSLALCLSYAKASAQQRTSPQPPKFKNNHVERTDLAAEIPYPIDGFRYRLDGNHAGTNFHPTAVPLWSFSSGRFQIGTMPVGSTVELKFVRAIGGRNFYGFLREAEESAARIPQIAWIDGRFIKIAGEN